MTEPRESAFHLTDGRLAAFLDGRLTSGERDQVLAHFAACVSCRREMTAARKLLAVPGAPRRDWRLPVVTLAAAALVFIAVPRLVRIQGLPPAGASTERAQPDVRPAVQIVAPAERSIVIATAVAFQWRAVGADATYRLTLQDSTGAVLWETTVGDTSATLSWSVRLAPSQEYFWSVDAQLADGRTAKPAVGRFMSR